MIVADSRVAHFVSSELGVALCPPFSVVGWERNGEVTAGIIINHFEGADCHVSVAGKGWTRTFMQAVGDYVFGQLGCIRMTAITEKPEVVRYAIRLGGVVEGRLRDHFGEGRDGIIIGILKRDYKWVRVAH